MQHRYDRGLGLVVVAVAGLLGAVVLGAPQRVQACGGLFCNSSRAIAVNQAAEQIIFSKNADGTVTAVIQIMYEGAANKFAWVLPVPGVPTVGVSSDQAFAMLKQQTNPSYSLQYQSSCRTAGPTGFGNASAPTSASGAGGSGSGQSVTVVASGAIGPYDYDVIKVNGALSDRAQVAVDWLTAHQYDVGPKGADVVRPYLMDDLNLIAFKLTKSATTGSIRPVLLTYTAALPSIPIRPTAVAANDDMGVMVWVLSSSRAIPQNYKALELNEALIDWFMPNNNYNKIVSLAADEAMGQGFVTEFAGKTTAFQKSGGGGVFPDYQQQNWMQFQSTMYADATSMIRDAMNNWGMWDGFDDALQASVTLPSTIAFKDFKACLPCYITASGVTFDSTKFLTKLYELVIRPMADTQALFDAAPYMTRLYTTMSAAEMTTDPAFDFNKDLPDVSNIHTATITTGCVPNGPWEATLAQGVTVKGSMMGVWPIAIDSQPAALKILEYGKQGPGKVIDDRTDMVAMLLKKSAMGGATGTGGTGGTAASGGTGGPASGGTGTGGRSGMGGSSSTMAGMAGAPSHTVDAGMAAQSDGSTAKAKASGGCAVAGQRAGDGGLLLLGSLAALFSRRRRMRS